MVLPVFALDSVLLFWSMTGLEEGRRHELGHGRVRSFRWLQYPNQKEGREIFGIPRSVLRISPHSDAWCDREGSLFNCCRVVDPSFKLSRWDANGIVPKCAFLRESPLEIERFFS